MKVLQVHWLHLRIRIILLFFVGTRWIIYLTQITSYSTSSRPEDIKQDLLTEL